MTQKVKPSTLADTTVTAGTYGGSYVIPWYTVDGQGRLTASGNTAITNASNASNITSGTLALARLAASTISGVTLGNNLNTLSLGVSGTGLSGSSSYNGSGAATFTVTSNATSANTAGAIVARDGNGDFSARNVTVSFMYGTAQYAQYADLAEVYTTDEWYMPGTVVAVNPKDDSEATETFEVGQLVLGVVSTNPAYVMNSGLMERGQAIGLRGRLPVRVVGPIKKGQTLTAGMNGVATVGTENKFGQALETNLEAGEKLVECVIF